MLKENLPEFTAMLIRVSRAFSKELNQDLVNFYWEMLRDFSFAEVQEAIRIYGTNPDTGKFFPLPADIVAAIKGNSREQALLAWTKVDTTSQSVGGYESIAFDDALIHVVIEDMGGWQKLCATSNAAMPFVAKEFQERYRGYVIHSPTRHPSYLVGIIESQNSRHNYRHSPPVLIGDKAQALRVIATGSGTALSMHYFTQKEFTQLSSHNPLLEEQAP